MKGSGGKNQRHAGGENAGRDARGQKASVHPRGVRLRLPLTDAERRAYSCLTRARGGSKRNG